ncbi:nickel ABC transporter substrate-binding protein [Inediibacterium massiliense]|uniref:nickel ABC transporter substrate-binding protein n=1 Tax=Inediibacterium massiliense TaxID=1658111 RepID=UPI0006B63574|nr:nickel ABC transporter substrate-binding protein [Inediibacterium massiliense]
MKKNITIMLAVMLVFTLMLSGCSSNISQSKENSLKTSGTQKSKELVIGYGIDVEGVNPKDCFETKYYMLSIVYDTLVKYDNGEIKPNLAESWEVNEDKTEYTFKLKEGITFSDGTPFNSEAVKKNLMAIKNVSRYWWLPITKDLKSIDIIDDYQFKLTMTKPSSAVLSNLLQYCPLGMVAPSTIKDLDPVTIEGSIGTGPYKLSDYEANKYYTFVQNEHYWGEKQNWDKVTLKIIPDSDARMLALSSGEIDVIAGSFFLPFDTIKSVSDNDKFTSKTSDTLVDTRNIKINTKSNILKNANVRKAIAHALNKKEIVNSIFSGYEEVYDSWLIKDLPYCDVSLKPYLYDIEKAKKLLDEAGWVQVDGSKYRQKDGKELKVEFGWISDFQTDKDLAFAIKGYLENIGIHVNAQSADLATWSNNFCEGKYDIVIDDMTPIPYQPYISINTLGMEKADGQFISGLPMKEELNKNIKIIGSSGNDEEIASAFEYILTTVHDEAVIIPIASKKEVILYNNNKIKDVKFANLPQMIVPDNIKSK